MEMILNPLMTSLLIIVVSLKESFGTFIPHKMKLKNVNPGYLLKSILDFMITIKYKKISIRVFEKRNSFPFLIVRMTHLKSYVISKIFYAAFGVDISRSVEISISRQPIMLPLIKKTLKYSTIK